jgi:hypothetical protein
MTNPREQEMLMLGRCVEAARYALPAMNARDANVFRLAAMVLESRHPGQSLRLMTASESYLRSHPAEKVASVEVVRQGWVASLPRLRDMLSERLKSQGVVS